MTEQEISQYESNEMMTQKCVPIQVKFTPRHPHLFNMSGGPYGYNTYHLDQLHFHWDCTDHHGSEHRVDGKQYVILGYYVALLGHFESVYGLKL